MTMMMETRVMRRRGMIKLKSRSLRWSRSIVNLSLSRLSGPLRKSNSAKVSTRTGSDQTVDLGKIIVTTCWTNLIRHNRSSICSDRSIKVMWRRNNLARLLSIKTQGNEEGEGIMIGPLWSSQVKSFVRQLTSHKSTPQHQQSWLSINREVNHKRILSDLALNCSSLNSRRLTNKSYSNFVSLSI